MRLIDADKIPWTDLNADMPNSKIKVLATFADKVNRMPTIEERKKGKWIVSKLPVTGGLELKCSNCDSALYMAFAMMYNFCPNCGADMRGGTDE